MGESAKSSTTFDEKTEALGKASAGAKDKQESHGGVLPVDSGDGVSLFSGCTLRS